MIYLIEIDSSSKFLNLLNLPSREKMNSGIISLFGTFNCLNQARFSFCLAILLSSDPRYFAIPYMPSFLRSESCSALEL